MRESERDGEKKEHLCVQVRVFVRKREIVCMCTNVCVSGYNCFERESVCCIFLCACERECVLSFLS